MDHRRNAGDSRPTPRRRDLMTLLCGAVATWPLGVLAQQPKVPTVGALVLLGDQLPISRQKLRDLGYVEGQSIRFEIRSAERDLHRLPELADELVRMKVDVIVAVATPAILAAKQATSEIPIVMVGVGDPVGMGIVASLAHPGGNVTGLSSEADLLTEKDVELLKETVPGVSRIAALCNAPDPFSKVFRDHARRAGDAQKVEIVPFMVTQGPELDAAFPAMVDQKVGAVIVQPSLPLAHVADLAIRHRLPTVGSRAGFATMGGLMDYSANPKEREENAAVFVDKILKGAKPADLPVQQPTKFELVINLKTAKALGLTISQSILARADEVIE
jgi:putative tryptophan/tyrosine transport system substrate-binding protein